MAGEGPEPIGRKMKKHTHEEILSKLDRAEELARAGKSQVDICKALGVSIMTLHRWRKLPLPKREAVAPQDRAGDSKVPANVLSNDEMRRVLEELTLENQRLRKIVTDLLLEKMRLEEAASATLPRQSSAQGRLQALLGPGSSG
ncbi:transposase [Bradyrhizobium sp. SYSU BS000235]|uniref:transposase n=1 Tax=Bradyrhizobium sp. SYSU BS000235 TaxID=3411332 RepID=UPI003C78D6C7